MTNALLFALNIGFVILHTLRAANHCETTGTIANGRGLVLCMLIALHCFCVGYFGVLTLTGLS